MEGEKNWEENKAAFRGNENTREKKKKSKGGRKGNWFLMAIKLTAINGQLRYFFFKLIQPSSTDHVFIRHQNETYE